MKKRYYNIDLPTNPTEVLQRLNLSIFSLLDNGQQNYMIGYCSHSDTIISIDSKEDYHILQSKEDYFFGYIPYDQKKHFLPKSNSNNPSFHQFDTSYFFKADGVIIRKNNTSLFFGYHSEYVKICSKLKDKSNPKGNRIAPQEPTELIAATNKESYLKNIDGVKKHIQNGDIYEMNYCIDFRLNNATLNSISTFNSLKDKTTAPFSALVQLNQAVILSASPERFINRKNNVLLSQPIKGTIKRGKTEAEDEKLIQTLESDQKEIAENVMIVDLVRNDLSKIALKASVQVKELCKIYSFKTVHQLISTIQCKTEINTSFATILEALFPMGSMTGAPKLSATEIIEKFENFRREIYSGSVGFLAPNNSFDFNVVIRSIIHNIEKKTISISVGSAITIKSEAEAEYNECLLKLKAIASALK